MWKLSHAFSLSTHHSLTSSIKLHSAGPLRPTAPASTTLRFPMLPFFYANHRGFFAWITTSFTIGPQPTTNWSSARDQKVIYRLYVFLKTSKHIHVHTASGETQPRFLPQWEKGYSLLTDFAFLTLAQRSNLDVPNVLKRNNRTLHAGV